jgi:hypothetical protein
VKINPDIELKRSQEKYAPRQGQLRFVEREVVIEDVTKKVRILQQWQWSNVDHCFDWYDIPLEMES